MSYLLRVGSKRFIGCQAISTQLFVPYIVRTLSCDSRTAYEERTATPALTVGKRSRPQDAAFISSHIVTSIQASQSSNNNPPPGERRLKATKDLISLPPQSWSPSHARLAEQCLDHWSKHLSTESHTILEFWTRLVSECEFSIEMTDVMYDFGVLALALHGQPQQAQSVWYEWCHEPRKFQNNNQNRRHVPNSYHLNAILHSYAQTGQPHRAEALLKQSFKNSETHPLAVPNSYSITSALDAWSREGNGQRALALLEWVEKTHSEVVLTVAAYNAVLAALAKSRAPREAEGLLRRLPVAPDATSWSSILQATCDTPVRAEALLKEAWHRNEPVNAVCFNIVLHAWGQRGDWVRALQLLQGWVQHVTDCKPKEEMWPNVTSFNTVLHALAKGGRGEQAHKLLEDMQLMGVAPDDITYNSVLDARARTGEANQAEALLNELEQRVWQPLGDESKHSQHHVEQRRIAYNSVIVAWANHSRASRHKRDRMESAQRAQLVLDRMKGQGIMPDVISYNAVLNAMASARDSTYASAASDLLLSMEQGPVFPDLISYSSVIDAFAKSGHPEAPGQARAILERMQRPDSPVRPNVISFNSVIHAYTRRSEPWAAVEAESILKEMESSDELPSPDLVTFCSVLSVWSGSRHVNKARRAWAVLERMEMLKENNPHHRPGLNPVELFRNAHNMVLAACAYTPQKASPAIRWDAIQIAFQTFAQVPHPNHVTYTSYFQSMYHLIEDVNERHERIQEAFESYCRDRRTIEPEVLRRLEKVTTKEFYQMLMKSVSLR